MILLKRYFPQLSPSRVMKSAESLSFLVSIGLNYNLFLWLDALVLLVFTGFVIFGLSV